jgi:hypothetical protein
VKAPGVVTAVLEVRTARIPMAAAAVPFPQTTPNCWRKLSTSWTV